MSALYIPLWILSGVSFLILGSYTYYTFVLFYFDSVRPLFKITI